MFHQYLGLPRIVYVLCLGTLINRCGMFLIIFLTLYLTQELGRTETFAGLALGAFGIGSIAAGFLGGWLADRVGRRPVLLISMLGAPPVVLLLAVVRSDAAILVTMVCVALLAEMYRPATAAMLTDLVPEPDRPQAFSLMFLCINLGAGIAPVVGGWLSERGFELLFIGDALTTAAYGVILLFCVPESRAPRPAPTSNGPPGLGAGARSGAFAPLADTPFVLFCIAIWLLALVYMQGISSFPLFMKSRGFTPREYGQVMMFNGLLIVAAQLFVTEWVRRLPRHRVLTAAAVIQGVGFYLIGQGNGLTLLILSVVIWTVAEMMQAPLMPTIVADLAPEDQRGRYMGIFQLAFAGAHVWGAPLGTWVLAGYGGPALWAACLWTSLAAAMLLWRLRWSLTRSALDPPQQPVEGVP